MRTKNGDGEGDEFGDGGRDGDGRRMGMKLGIEMELGMEIGTDGAGDGNENGNRDGVGDEDGAGDGHEDGDGVDAGLGVGKGIDGEWGCVGLELELGWATAGWLRALGQPSSVPALLLFPPAPGSPSPAGTRAELFKARGKQALQRYLLLLLIVWTPGRAIIIFPCDQNVGDYHKGCFRL